MESSKEVAKNTETKKDMSDANVNKNKSSGQNEEVVGHLIDEREVLSVLFQQVSMLQKHSYCCLTCMLAVVFVAFLYFIPKRVLNFPVL